MTEIGLDGVRAAVSAVVRDVPEVSAVYAYGSRIAGRPLPGSDLDLAFVLGGGPPPQDPLFAERLSARIAVELRTDVEIDGHLAEHLPLPVQGRVVTTGVLVFERDPVRRVAFETATRRLYFDYLPYIERDARFALGARG